MTVTQTTLGALTVSTQYFVKFAMLQKVPYYITITAIASDGTATVEYRYNSTDVTPFQTITGVNSNNVVFLLTIEE